MEAFEVVKQLKENASGDKPVSIFFFFFSKLEYRDIIFLRSTRL